MVSFEKRDGKDYEEAKEKLVLIGAETEVVEVRPDEEKDEVPTLIVPGWSMGHENYREGLELLARKKRRAISLNFPRHGGEFSSAGEEARNVYPEEELRKALTIIDLINKKEIGRADVVAHSESATNVVIAAMIHPEKFRNIVFYGPSGLVGKDTFMRLLKGFIGQMKERPKSLDELSAGEKTLPAIPITETEKSVVIRAFTEGVKYFARNPARALREAGELSRTQIHDMLKYLHEKGVGIGIIHGVDDPVYPMDRIQKMVKADMVDGFMSVRGGHGEIGTHPEIYMAAAEELLTAIEKKRRERKALKPIE